MAGPINFDFKRVIVTLGGVPVDGFADGDSIKIEHAADLYTMGVGNDGAGWRAKQNNNAATITITLIAGAPANKRMQELLDKDRVSGTGTFAVAITDLGGSYLAGTTSAWIKKDPGRTLGKDNSTIEWVLDTIDLTDSHDASTVA